LILKILPLKEVVLRDGKPRVFFDAYRGCFESISLITNSKSGDSKNIISTSTDAIRNLDNNNKK
jgi:hypothetical protein